jgi:DNA-binding transcriptional MerR regulator/effector-binding domain-containing protein
MSVSVPIGEFSRLTHLSVKTLHHYHDIGLLEPARIDPSSGYRRYETAQVRTAQLIRRLRELDMPLPQVRELVEAPDPDTRNRVLQRHLEQMEAELVRTQQVVASLRTMLLPAAGLPVEYRRLPAFTALAIRDRVDRSAIGPFCQAGFPALYDAAARAGARIAGPGGATYADEFFTDDAGEVVAYVPVHRPVVATGAELVEMPAGDFAIAVHEGDLVDFDRTYGALGSHVAEHCTVVPGPIREVYVVGPGDVEDPARFRTEVCWPIAGG